MKKTELLYLHALLIEVRRNLETDSRAKKVFREYERHGVGPRQVHQSKADHQTAIQFLLIGIQRIIAKTEPPHQSDSPDTEIGQLLDVTNSD